jgi:pre-rRNA-processing protein TSR2
MTTPTPDQRQHAFEQSVATALHLWPALTLAVQSGWGGPDSADKRAWFAGALVDAFPTIPAHLLARQRPSQQQQQQQQPTTTTTTRNNNNDQENNEDDDNQVPDEEYVEIMLLQVMQDEFEVTVEDDSAADVAERIVRLWGKCLAGDLSEAEQLVERWQSSRGKGAAAAAAGQFTRGTDPDQEVDGDEWEDDDDDDEDEDDVMGEAPALVEASKEKPPPEVDEDGFTKVTRRKR